MSEQLNGTEGNDSLEGGEGNDTLIGLGGNDTLNGMAGDDVLEGSAGNNVLYGQEGDDTLSGGIGNDTLRGGLGSDLLIGYSGIDWFVFDVAPGEASGVDEISDFDPGHTLQASDRIVLLREHYTAFAFVGEVAADNLRIGAGITAGLDNDDFLLYDPDLSILYYDADGSGPISAVVVAQVYVESLLADHILIFTDDPDLLVGTEGNDTLSGGSGNDEMLGLGGADLLTGGAGDDSLHGGGGADTLIGGAGNDRLDGGSGGDHADYSGAASSITVDLRLTTPQVTGGAGTDTLLNIEGLIGSALDDLLIGDDNSNTLEGGAGNDTLDGAAGMDTASYASAAAAVVVTLLSNQSQATGGAGNDTLLNIENLTGSQHDDHLIGDQFGNLLQGLGGNDTLDGGGGNDTLIGDAGDDVLLGGDGNDFLRGALGNDVLDGGAGIDRVSYLDMGSAVSVDLNLTGPQQTGSGGVDTLLNIEQVLGTQFADYLVGDAGDNYLNGHNGNDTLIGGDGNDTQEGGGGMRDLLEGGNGDDLLVGGRGNDTLYGGNGNDTLRGGGGVDALDGGEGIDYIDNSNAPDRADASLASGWVYWYSVGGAVTMISIEGLIASPHGGSMSGDAFDNTLIGGIGEDWLYGGGGNDVLDGGEGDDDHVTYQAASSGVSVSLGITGPQDTGAVGFNTLLNIEHIYGSLFDDHFTGDSGNNWLRGLDGNDSLFGAGGDDTLVGGLGNDLLDGGDGVDTVDYFDTPQDLGGILLDLALLAPQDTGGWGVDTLINIEHVLATPYDDHVSGDAGANYLRAYSGADSLFGGGGNDSLRGDEGNDLLVGGTGVDTVNYDGNRAEFDLVYLGSGEWQLTDTDFSLRNEGSDLLHGIEKLQFGDELVYLPDWVESAVGDADVAAQLYQFFAVAFSAAPGTFYMEQLAAAYESGMSVQTIVNVFTAKTQFTDLYPGSLTHQQLAEALVEDVVKDSATAQHKLAAVDDIALALDSGLSRGDVIYTVFGNLAAKPFEDPVWGDTALQFHKQLEVASYLTEELGYGTTDVSVLRGVLSTITPQTDVSTEAAILELIGVWVPV